MEGAITVVGFCSLLNPVRTARIARIIVAIRARVLVMLAQDKDQTRTVTSTRRGRIVICGRSSK